MVAASFGCTWSCPLFPGGLLRCYKSLLHTLNCPIEVLNFLINILKVLVLVGSERRPVNAGEDFKNGRWDQKSMWPDSILVPEHCNVRSVFHDLCEWQGQQVHALVYAVLMDRMNNWGTLAYPGGCKRQQNLACTISLFHPTGFRVCLTKLGFLTSSPARVLALTLQTGANPRYHHCYVDEDAMAWTKSNLAVCSWVRGCMHSWKTHIHIQYTYATLCMMMEDL